MKQLKDATDKELEAELAARKKAREAGDRPVALAQPDWKPVLKMAADHMKAIESNGREDEDFDHYLYEAAMTAIYGPNVFKWINKKLT